MGLEAVGPCCGASQGACGYIWNLLTQGVGSGYWGGGGGRVLPLPLPPGWVGEFGGTPLPLATHVPGSPGDLPVKFLGVISALPLWMHGEEDPWPSSLLLKSSITCSSIWDLPLLPNSILFSECPPSAILFKN